MNDARRRGKGIGGALRRATYECNLAGGRAGRPASRIFDLAGKTYALERTVEAFDGQIHRDIGFDDSSRPSPARSIARCRLPAAASPHLRHPPRARGLSRSASHGCKPPSLPGCTRQAPCMPNARSFTLVSVEKLLRMLTAFDQDVEITVKPHRKRGESGRITFIPA